MAGSPSVYSATSQVTPTGVAQMGQSSPQTEATGCGDTSSGWETQRSHKVSCDVCCLSPERAEAEVTCAASSFGIGVTFPGAVATVNVHNPCIVSSVSVAGRSSHGFSIDRWPFRDYFPAAFQFLFLLKSEQIQSYPGLGTSPLASTAVYRGRQPGSECLPEVNAARK